jgi:tetratricopeptide (TPR) repeat protein
MTVAVLLSLLLATSASATAPRHSTTSAASAASSRPTHAIESLDWALKFASAIRSDEKDRSRAEESVVLDFAVIGALDEGLQRADRVEGWRKGVACAELAAALAGMGRLDEAKVWIAKAEAIRATISGWQNPRIAAHIANARAAVGEVEGARTNAAVALAEDERQYAGRAAASLAIAYGRAEKLDQALAELAPLDADADIDVAVARTHAYVELSKLKSLEVEQRLALIEKAHRSVAQVSSFLRVESLQSLAEAETLAGAKPAALKTLAEAATVARSIPPSAPLKGLLMSGVAKGFTDAGDATTGIALLREALEVAPQTQPIERPAVLGAIAAGYRAVGEAMESRRVLDLAFSGAESLVNARPRALAVVEICRSMGRVDMPLDATSRDRLKTLFAGLKDPW